MSYSATQNPTATRCTSGTCSHSVGRVQGRIVPRSVLQLQRFMPATMLALLGEPLSMCNRNACITSRQRKMHLEVVIPFCPTLHAQDNVEIRFSQDKMPSGSVAFYKIACEYVWCLCAPVAACFWIYLIPTALSSWQRGDFMESMLPLALMLKCLQRNK